MLSNESWKQESAEKKKGLFLKVLDILINQGGAYDSNPTDGMLGDVCPLGHYCPESSPVPTYCPDGEYSNSTQVTNSSLTEWASQD